MEFMRYDSPVRAPQGLAWDGTRLWVASCATNRMSAIDPATLAITHEVTPPGEPFGITAVPGGLRVVVGFGEDADDRYIMRYTADAGFSEERIACPNLSGSFLAFDGHSLWLSQAWDMQLLQLNERGEVVRAVALERRPVGMTFARERLYLLTVDDEWGDARFGALDVDAERPVPEVLCAIPFEARSVAFDGRSFWIADREGDGLIAIR
ncbi:MAG TPA: hypothetical protein VFN49_13360 [Candidatus Aquilonibacter sp.]|nr:hypothetical protein [Candidatus Aquilonibacter sp.]